MNEGPSMNRGLMINSLSSATAASCAMSLWAMWLCCALGAPVFAAEPVAGLLACRALTDAGARLACFDREIASIDPHTVGGVGASPSAAGVPAPDPKQQFGLPERAIVTHEIASGARAADAAKIEAHVVRIASAANGHAVFSLDNDQVWRQLASSGELLIKPGDAVTISRGTLGSFWLATGTGRGCKVSRLR